MIDLQPAGAADAAPLLALREAAAAWIRARGVAGWQPGEVALDTVRRQVAAGEWHVARTGGNLDGGLRLLQSDEPIWGPQPLDALYVHGLVVAVRGQGLGAQLLDWAQARGRESGRDRLRLDCAATNRPLRAWYADRGCALIRERDLPPYGMVALLERRHLLPSADGRP